MTLIVSGNHNYVDPHAIHGLCSQILRSVRVDIIYVKTKNTIVKIISKERLIDYVITSIMIDII